MEQALKKVQTVMNKTKAGAQATDDAFNELQELVKKQHDELLELKKREKTFVERDELVKSQEEEINSLKKELEDHREKNKQYKNYGFQVSQVPVPEFSPTIEANIPGAGATATNSSLVENVIEENGEQPRPGITTRRTIHKS